jgi:anti-sigma regulatory factor (Ser/Thr protein kinase)
MSENWSHQADWPALPENVSAARRFVAERLHSHGLDTLAGDARLVVSELATNAIVHARTPFTVMLSGTVKTLLISVTDGSMSEFGPPTAAVWSAVHGRGLHLVGAYSQEWGITPTRSGKTVWANFSLA